MAKLYLIAIQTDADIGRPIFPKLKGDAIGSMHVYRLEDLMLKLGVIQLAADDFLTEEEQDRINAIDLHATLIEMAEQIEPS